MCTPMIIGLSGRIVTRLKCRSEIALSACRYLTSSQNWTSAYPAHSTNSECGKYLKLCDSYQPLYLRCAFSTLPKGKPYDKDIIADVTVRAGQQVDRKHNEADKTGKANEEPPAQKLGLFARFKLMYKQYWYVLIPVHVITSIGWFAGFYYLSQSGVDIPSLLQTIHMSDTVIAKLKDSSMGHIAIAYLCYKIATPIRYMVTLGGTTVSIKYLEQFGYIKPMPSRSQLMQMYEDKKADMAKRRQDRMKDD